MACVSTHPFIPSPMHSITTNNTTREDDSVVTVDSTPLPLLHVTAPAPKVCGAAPMPPQGQRLRRGGGSVLGRRGVFISADNDAPLIAHIGVEGFEHHHHHSDNITVLTETFDGTYDATVPVDDHIRQNTQDEEALQTQLVAPHDASDTSDGEEDDCGGSVWDDDEDAAFTTSLLPHEDEGFLGFDHPALSSRTVAAVVRYAVGDDEHVDGVDKETYHRTPADVLSLIDDEISIVDADVWSTACGICTGDDFDVRSLRTVTIDEFTAPEAQQPITAKKDAIEVTVEDAWEEESSFDGMSVLACEDAASEYGGGEDGFGTVDAAFMTTDHEQLTSPSQGYFISRQGGLSHRYASGTDDATLGVRVAHTPPLYSYSSEQTSHYYTAHHSYTRADDELPPVVQEEFEEPLPMIMMMLPPANGGGGGGGDERGGDRAMLPKDEWCAKMTGLPVDECMKRFPYRSGAKAFPDKPPANRPEFPSAITSTKHVKCCYYAQRPLKKCDMGSKCYHTHDDDDGATIPECFGDGHDRSERRGAANPKAVGKDVISEFPSVPNRRTSLPRLSDDTTGEETTDNFGSAAATKVFISRAALAAAPCQYGAKCVVAHHRVAANRCGFDSDQLALYKQHVTDLHNYTAAHATYKKAVREAKAETEVIRQLHEQLKEEGRQRRLSHHHNDVSGRGGGGGGHAASHNPYAWGPAHSAMPPAMLREEPSSVVYNPTSDNHIPPTTAWNAPKPFNPDAKVFVPHQHSHPTDVATGAHNEVASLTSSHLHAFPHPLPTASSFFELSKYQSRLLPCLHCKSQRADECSVGGDVRDQPCTRVGDHGDEAPSPAIVPPAVRLSLVPIFRPNPHYNGLTDTRREVKLLGVRALCVVCKKTFAFDDEQRLAEYANSAAAAAEASLSTTATTPRILEQEGQHMTQSTTHVQRVDKVEEDAVRRWPPAALPW